MRTGWLRRVGFPALIVLAAAVAVAPSAARSGIPKQVPFHATADFTLTPAAVTAPCAPTELRFNVAVTKGVATHLGNFTSGDYFTCLNPLTLEFHGRYVFIAANGDTIEGGYAGRFVATADPATLGVDAHWSIEGGTGRFAGATGGGAASGSGTLTGGHLILDGSISSVGSLR